MQLLLRAEPAQELTRLPSDRLDGSARARRARIARNDLQDPEGLVSHPHRYRIRGGEAGLLQLLPARRIRFVRETAGEDGLAARPGRSREPFVGSHLQPGAEQPQVLSERRSDMARAAMDQLSFLVDEPGETDVEAEVLAERGERALHRFLDGPRLGERPRQLVLQREQAMGFGGARLHLDDVGGPRRGGTHEREFEGRQLVSGPGARVQDPEEHAAIEERHDVQCADAALRYRRAREARVGDRVADGKPHPRPRDFLVERSGRGHASDESTLEPGSLAHDQRRVEERGTIDPWRFFQERIEEARRRRGEDPLPGMGAGDGAARDLRRGFLEEPVRGGVGKFGREVAQGPAQERKLGGDVARIGRRKIDGEGSLRDGVENGGERTEQCRRTSAPSRGGFDG